tara:strand:- start:308 stop:781 length:474 start_codon:yes stop_codon:yes gene_type:complete
MTYPLGSISETGEMTGRRIVTPEKKAKMVILRGMGYSHSEISKKFGISRSAVTKQLSRIRERCKSSDKENGDEYGFLREFFNLMLDSEDLDYSSIIALGNQKYTYENLRYQKMTRKDALRYSRSTESIHDPPWIINPNFDGLHTSARKSLWRESNEE